MASIVSAGTTSATALNMSADTSGVLQLASNNGTVALTISTSQNVGFGTTSPNFECHISTGSTASITQPTAGSYGLYVQQNTSGSVGGIYIQDGASNSGASLYIADNNGAARFVVDTDGGVNVGSSANYGGLLSVNRAQTSSIADLLTLRDASAGTTFNLQTYGDPSAGTANRFNYDGAYLAFRRAGTEQARFDSSGNLLVGTTTASAKLTVYSPTASAITASFTNLPADNNFQVGFSNGASTNTAGSSIGRLAGYYAGNEIASISITRSGGASAQDLRVVVGSAGVSLANGGTSWTSLSDERQKTNLKPIENAVAKVSSLRTMTGRYLYDDVKVSRAFLIAQDVLAVLPEAVNIQPDEDGTLGLQYTDVIPLLTAAIKEQQAIITALTTRVTALENK